MIKLIIGRAGSGKTDRIMNEIRDKGERGESGMIVVVPEQFSHDTERALCRVCGDGASLWCEVLSFSRLSSRVLSQTGGYGVKPLDPGGRLLLMSLALNDVAHELKSYRAVRSRAELLKGLIQEYDEFTAAGIGPEELTELSAEVAEKGLRDKLWDMGLIFEAYRARMPEDMCDPSGRLEMMAERLEDCDLFTNTVYFDGFTDFTYQQRLVIKKLMKLKRELAFCLTLDAIYTREEVFRLTRDTAALLHRYAHETNNQMEIEVIEPSGPAAPELRHLEENLLRNEKKPFTGECDAIEMYSLPNVWDECELAAAKTIEAVRELGLRWRDAAVVSRSMDKYATILESVFSKYGIPVMTTAKSDILARPVMALVIGALDIVSGGWDYETVFRYLKTELTGMDRAARDELENYVIQWNIRGQSMWLRPQPWSFHPRGYNQEMTEDDAERLRRINELREQFAVPFRALNGALHDRPSASEKVKALYGFLRAVGVPEALAGKVERLRSGGNLRLAGEYTQLWDILVEAMEQFSDVLGDTDISVQEFRRLFTILLGQYQVGTIPVSLDRVAVGDMAKTRGGVKCLIVLGADAESLPRTAGQRGLISDCERDELKELGHGLDDDSDRIMQREYNMIYSALTMPTQRLIISYSGGGQPSEVVTEISEMFGIDCKTHCEDGKTNAIQPCFELALTGDGEAKAYFDGIPEWRDRLAETTAAALSPRGQLSPETAKRLYSRELTLSASKVDKFNSCKFMYFMEYGLRAGPRREARFDAPAAGTFMHYILENAARDAERAGGFGSLTPTDCEELTRKYVVRYVNELLGGLEDKSARFIYLFRRLADAALRIVTDMAEELAVSDFRPLDFELSLGRGGDVDTVTVSDGDMSVNVNGKIDRVDGWVHDGKLYLRVVDYKTGKKAFNLSDIWYGMGIQMLLYLFALRQKGGARYGMEIEPAGVLYAPAADVTVQAPLGADRSEIEKERAKKLVRKGLILNDPDVIEAMEHQGSGRFLPVKFNKDGQATGDSIATAEQLGSLAAHIDNVLLEMGREMRRGLITADPCRRGPTDSVCGYCDFKEACRFDEESGDRARYLKKLKAAEVWALLCKR